MTGRNKETTMFWAMWGLGPIAAVLAISATGLFQSLGEGYLTFIALFNAVLAVATVNSPQLQEKMAQARIAKRTPGGIEWASIAISMLVGIALSNYILVVCSMLYAVLKHRIDRLFVASAAG